MSGYEWAFDPTSKRRTIHLVATVLSGKPSRRWTACMVTSYEPDHPIIRPSISSAGFLAMGGLPNSEPKIKPGMHCSKCTALSAKEPHPGVTSLSSVVNDPEANRATWHASEVIAATVPPPERVPETDLDVFTETVPQASFWSWAVIAVCIGVLSAFAIYYFFFRR